MVVKAKDMRIRIGTAAEILFFVAMQVMHLSRAATLK